MSGKKQVLIVCQTAAGQMYLGILLNRIWYTPLLAKSPEEGVHLSQTTSFSLVLYDADVSRLELLPAITLLKTATSLKDVPLAVFITDDNPVLNRQILDLGCSAILTKPLDLSIVYGVLGRLSGQPRSSFRVPVKMRVEIEEGVPDTYLTSVNISEGGIYLRTAEPLPAGEVLHIRFTLPHDSREIKLAAEVVRSLSLGIQLEAEPGMGLRFIDAPDDTLGRIKNFVQWEMMGDLERKSGM